jgi:hypothetical protein
MGKANCWEFMKCGREPGGTKVAELGVCPAATDTKSDAINEGRNGGRICWAVAGNMCGGAATCTFALALPGCLACDFYARVLADRKRTRATRDMHKVE